MTRNGDMKEQATSAGTLPRFDSLLTAAENRRDDWQRLQGLVQAWAAAADGGGGDGAGARKLAGETRELLARLGPPGGLWESPGPTRVRKLRDRLDAAAAAGCSEMARRLAKA